MNLLLPALTNQRYVSQFIARLAFTRGTYGKDTGTGETGSKRISAGWKSGAGSSKRKSASRRSRRSRNPDC
jgi:hypothetical protein